MEKATLIQRYQELQAINDGAASLEEPNTPSLRSVRRFNEIIEEISKGTGDDSLTHYTARIIDSYGIQTAPLSEFRQNVYTATRIIHENHLKDSTLPPQQPIPSAAEQPQLQQSFQQNQSSNQTTEVSVEFNQTLIALTEILTQKEAELDDGTPEKGFIQKLKSRLSEARNTIDVIQLAMTFAAEFGLTVQQVKDLLS